MRLIDADKFIEWLDIGHLRSPSEICFSEGDVEVMIDIQPTIEAVPVVHGWIPCSERLPEDGKNCLITYISFLDGITKCCDGCAYVIENGWFWCLDDSEVNVDVIAWMPLPEPYKGE
jgi:hypothetical protein